METPDKGSAKEFQSTPPRGRRHADSLDFQVQRVSIHASEGEATTGIASDSIRPMVSIHASEGEATIMH